MQETSNTQQDLRSKDQNGLVKWEESSRIAMAYR